MGLFHFFKKEKGFEKVAPQSDFTLENQDGLRHVDSEADIHRFFDIMLEDEEQHMILTSPAAIAGVRYVQAVRSGEQIEVEIGIEKGGGTCLYFKMCEPRAARNIFLDFYHGCFAPDWKEYAPVRF